MKKYGEIDRFLSPEGFMYRVTTFKLLEHPIKSEVYLPIIVVSITQKTAKKIRAKNLDKMDMKFKLVENISITTIRRLRDIVQGYLNKIVPPYIGYLLYQDPDQARREKFYKRMLERMGYTFFQEEKDEEGKFQYFKRTLQLF